MNNTKTTCTLTHHDFGIVMSPENNKPTPVIITVQHNGHTPRVFGNIFEPRDGNWESDMKSADMAKEIFRLSIPYTSVMWNTIPRKFLETNVPKNNNAYADPRMESYFDSFHNTLTSLVQKAVAYFGKDKVLIIDLHVFERQPCYSPPGGYDTILGTGNRDTVLNKSSNQPFSDLDIKLSKTLMDAGIITFLPKEKTVQASGRPDLFNGGFLVTNQAKINQNIAAAIQIETRNTLSQGDNVMSESAKEKRLLLIQTIANFIERTYSVI